MIKRLLFLFGLIFCTVGARAACTTPITAGMNASQIQTALNSCSSGSTASYPAGTYTVASTVTIPCGVSMTGPAQTYSQTPNQTATINGSTGSGWGFQTSTGCGSASSTIQYLAWNGGQPSNGGGFLNISSGSSNITVQHNWLHGVNSPAGAGDNNAYLIYMGGGSLTTITSNISILWNYFGTTSLSDCITPMNNPNAPGENDAGGLCGAVGMQTGILNVTIANNIMNWLEEPIKGFETPSGSGAGYNCNNLVVDNNNIQNYSRIGYEIQCYNPGTATLTYTQYNNWGSRYNGMLAYDVSLANGCNNNTYASGPGMCENHTDYNFDLETQAAPTAESVGFEIWGQGPSGCTTHCSSAMGNLFQGYLYNAITFAPSGNFNFNNNTFRIVSANGNNQNCTTSAPTSEGGFYHIEDSPAFNATCTGNSFSNTITGTNTSATPTISPAGGTFSGSQVVTLANTGTGRDTNTSIWYCTTTSGSCTPTPGSSTLYTGPFTITASTNVYAVGMWGAANQPYSYPSGYGYVPSSPVSATFTISGSSPAATPTFSPASETFNGTISVTASSSTSGATLYCTTNGTTPTTSSPVYSGPFSVAATTQIQCIATASGFSQSAVGSGTYTQATAATPVLTPSSSSSFYPTQSVTITDSTSGSTIYYTLDGSTPTTSSNVYSTALTLNATTTVKAISAASGYQNSAVASGTYAYTTPTLTGATSTNSGAVTSIAIGGTLNQIGQCSYSAGPTYACNSTDTNGGKIISWASSNTAVFTVSSAGLVTGIGTGTANVNCQAQQGSSTPVTCTPYAITVVNSPPTLTGVTIALQVPPGGSTVTIGTPVQACGTLTYTGGITTTQCNNSADAYGTVLSAWTSSAPSKGTISTSGLVTGVANGTTNISVTATNGATTFNASPATITINTAVVGANVFCSGCYMSGGVVSQ